MSETRKYVHPEGAQKVRADKALAAFFSGEFSRSKLEESFRSGKVLFEGESIPKRFEINPGDEVEIELPERDPAEIEGVYIPLNILYEDDDIVVVDKPSGMTVHPGSGTGRDTLVHAMLFHCGGKLAAASGAARPGIVHRLDKETSGAMVMAKTDSAYYSLVEMFSERRVEKEYSAIISGVPSVRSGSIRKPIGRHPSFKTKMCVDPSGREARTDWFVVEKYGNKACLVSCKIMTGRTHQIRVHMSDAGFPLFGDYTYSFQKNRFKEVPAPQRVMLHSRRIAFSHPISGKSMEFEAPFPADFSSAVESLKSSYGE